MIEDAAAGDAVALGRLFRRYASRLLGFLMPRLGNREVAEEVLQDVFLDAWRRAATFDRRRGSFRTWIFLRARSRAIDRLRSRRARVAREGNYGSTAERRDPTSREVAKATVERALSALTDRQRACVEMAFYDGRSLRQVATALEIPLGTAKSRYLSGMRKLRARYCPGPG